MTDPAPAITADVAIAEPTPEEFARIHLVAALRLARMLVRDGSAEDVAAESVARLLAARRRVAVDNVDARVNKATAAGATLMRPLFDVPGVGRIAILREPGGAGVGWMTPVTS